MRPRDINEGNWDVNVAVFEADGFDARITADGKRMWFRVSIGIAIADVLIPISDFRKATDFVSKFDLKSLNVNNPTAGKKLGAYYVEVFNSVGKYRNGKIQYKKAPAHVFLAPTRQRIDHSIFIRLSLFRKMIHWYNSDL